MTTPESEQAVDFSLRNDHLLKVVRPQGYLSQVIKRENAVVNGRSDESTGENLRRNKDYYEDHILSACGFCALRNDCTIDDPNKFKRHFSSAKTRQQLAVKLQDGRSAQPDVKCDDIGTKQREKSRASLGDILTPDFQGLEIADYAGISQDWVAWFTPDNLRSNLLPERPNDDAINIRWFKAGETGETVFVALTPEENSSVIWNVKKSSAAAQMKLLRQRDKKVQEATGDKSKKARTQEDLDKQARKDIRQTQSMLENMQRTLDTEIKPRIDSIDQFREMTNHPNLVRGGKGSVKQDYRDLDSFVFDDMLDAVGLSRGWNAETRQHAIKTLQKKLYISGPVSQRVESFTGLVELMSEYYGYKMALFMTRIHEAKMHIATHPDVVNQIKEIDEQRAREKQEKLQAKQD